MNKTNTKSKKATGRELSPEETNQLLAELQAKWDAENAELDAELEALTASWKAEDSSDDDDDGDDGEEDNEAIAIAKAERLAEEAEARATEIGWEVVNLKREIEQKNAVGAIWTNAQRKKVFDVEQKYQRAKREANRLRSEAKRLKTEAETLRQNQEIEERELHAAFKKANPSASEKDFQRLLPQLRDRQMIERTLKGENPIANHPIYQNW